MGYQTRCFYAIDDLKKLIQRKVSRGISMQWQMLAYSYLTAFCQAIHLEPVGVPEALDIMSVSIHASNAQICQELHITQKIADDLHLETLRPDFERHRKQRFIRQQGRSSRVAYQQNCRLHRAEQAHQIHDLMARGVSKTRIAATLGISRKHVYHLLQMGYPGVRE
ncbi:MAG: hypothetical protein ABF969_01120 [Sporolactobacillus sp.]